MSIEFFDINDMNKISIVVIYAIYKGKIVMGRHKKRNTWEIPEGPIEKVRYLKWLQKENFMKKQELKILL